MAVSCAQEHRNAAQVTCTPHEACPPWPTAPYFTCEDKPRTTVACGQTGREGMKGVCVTRDEGGGMREDGSIKEGRWEKGGQWREE